MFGASIMNLTAMNQGGFAGGRGGWLASVRRGYLDIVFDITGEGDDLSPTYYDAMAKVQYRLAPGHMVSAHMLYAGDDVTAVDDGVHVSSAWRNGYAWANWKAELGATLSAETVLSVGRLSRDRTGAEYDPLVGGDSGIGPS